MKEWMKDFQLQDINVLIMYTLIAKWRKGVGRENPPSETWKLSDTKNELNVFSTRYSFVMICNNMICNDSLCTLSSGL